MGCLWVFAYSLVVFKVVQMVQMVQMSKFNKLAIFAQQEKTLAKLSSVPESGPNIINNIGQILYPRICWIERQKRFFKYLI